MLILHDNVESGNAYKARLLLSLMGKEYKCIQYDVVNGETSSDEFLKNIIKMAAFLSLNLKMVNALQNLMR